MSSTTTQEEKALPLGATELRAESTEIDPPAKETFFRYNRLEPVFGSFQLHLRDGEVCTKHLNGGGLISLDARVGLTVLVSENAAVLGRASVHGAVRLLGQAVIEGDATVSGQVTLQDESRVSGRAVLDGHITMRRHSRVDENAHLRGVISLDYYAHVGAESRLFGNMHLE